MLVKDIEICKAFSKGLFAVNKVKHFTSAEVVTQLKETILRDVDPKDLPDPFKVGHGGTLDDTATGVLVIGTGAGCQYLHNVLHGSKKYTVTGCLGSETTTYNDSGIHIKAAQYDHITKESLTAALSQFRGTILQKPPLYSALKLGGRRIADLTRSGINVEMKPRYVTCYDIKCIDFELPFFTLQVHCGAGFYIRSLIHDLGLALQSRAHVSVLHRNQQEPFSEDDMLESRQWTVTDMANAIQQTWIKYGHLLDDTENSAMGG